MTLHRFAPRRDANERAIIDTLRARGFSVTSISGTGVPDLLIGQHGRMALVEVKQPTGRLTPAQMQWRDTWRGPAPYLLRSINEALALDLQREAA